MKFKMASFSDEFEEALRDSMTALKLGGLVLKEEEEKKAARFPYNPIH